MVSKSCDSGERACKLAYVVAGVTNPFHTLVPCFAAAWCEGCVNLRRMSDSEVFRIAKIINVGPEQGPSPNLHLTLP